MKSHAKPTRFSLLFLLFLGYVSTIPPCLSAGAYIGEAFDKRTEQLLYTEYHYPNPNDNLNPLTEEVLYINPQGTLLVKKQLDFSRSLTYPDYSAIDYRTGLNEGAKYLKDRIEVFYQKSKVASKKVKDLKIASKSPLVIDAGFDHFIRQEWTSLTEGKSVPFFYASAAEQKLVKFKLKKTKETQQEVSFSMSLANPLITWLLAPIQLTYEKNTRRLKTYEGISNIQDNTGKNFHVRINYQWVSQPPVVDTF